MNKPISYQCFLNEQIQKNYASLCSDYTYIVIIPRTGCHACVEAADSFFEENKYKKDYLFVFTKLVSEKRLRIELGVESLKLLNVKIDKKNIFFSSEFVDSEYPLILEKDGNGIFHYSFLDSKRDNVN